MIYIKNTRNIRIVTTIVVIIVMILWGVITNKEKKYVDKEQLKSTIQEINNMCNSVYSNVEESEIKYLELFENEDDPLRKGMYASTLLQVYSIKADYDNVVKYGEEAVENYMEIEGGVYYAISETKYLLWTMFGLGRYSDSFTKAHELMDLIKLYSGEYLDENEITDAESLVYSILLMIYSEFNLTDNAKIYYEKLCEIEITPELELARGEKIAFSKMIYAEKNNNYELMKYYAEDIYRISLKNDEVKNVETAEATLMDIGHANIKLGNLNIGLEQIQRAEKLIVKMNSQSSLAEIYSIYGEYYDKIGDFNNSEKYYIKSLDLQENIGNMRKLFDVLSKLTNLREKYGFSSELADYYSSLYKLYKYSGIDRELGQIFIEAIEVNDKLSEQKYQYLKMKSEDARKKNLIITATMVILFISIIKMKKIIDIKREDEIILEKIINRDYLTQVNTRAYGYKQIEKLIEKNEKFTIAIIDIDNFKSINDVYGHLFGDEVLKAVAKVLVENIEDEDFVIRFGGEEFIIVFESKTKSECVDKLEKLKAKVNKIELEKDLIISFSAGTKDWDNTSLNSVIKEADELLYEAKNKGKNRIS